MKRYVFLLIGVMVFSSCVQKTFKREVNFIIDTNHLVNVETIGIRGGMLPLNWNEDITLDDKDADGIFEVTVIFDTPYDYVEVKFVKNNNVFELQDQPNRQVIFDKDGTTIYKAKFDIP